MKKKKKSKKISGASAKNAKQNFGNPTIVFVIEIEKGKLKKGHVDSHGKNGHIN